jgi:hypothetical protein
VRERGREGRERERGGGVCVRERGEREVRERERGVCVCVREREGGGARECVWGGRSHHCWVNPLMRAHVDPLTSSTRATSGFGRGCTNA